MNLAKQLATAEEMLDTLLTYGAPEDVLLKAYEHLEGKINPSLECLKSRQSLGGVRTRVDRAQSDKYRGLGRRVWRMVNSQRRNGKAILER